MHFEPDFAPGEPDLDGITHDLNRSALLDLVHEPGNILVVHPEAAMADRHTDAKLLVGTVNQVAVFTEQQGVTAQWVIRARRNHSGQKATGGLVFCPDTGGGIPSRRFQWHGHPGVGQRRGILCRAHPDRIHLHAVIGKVVQAVFRQVDNNTLAPGIRKHILPRQGDQGAFPREPGVDTGIGLHQLQVPQRQAVADARKGILVAGLIDPQFTHQVALDGKRGNPGTPVNGFRLISTLGSVSSVCPACCSPGVRRLCSVKYRQRQHLGQEQHR